MAAPSSSLNWAKTEIDVQNDVGAAPGDDGDGNDDHRHGKNWLCEGQSQSNLGS